MTEKTLTRASPAKINLTLRIVGRRSDGYHELESLVARITLCDAVSVTPWEDGVRTVACDDPTIPTDERNLALRAALRLAEHTGCRRGVHITLTKRIPAGAGLGGGSSNAATVLLLLNDLWELGLPRAELATIGAQVGSDVPLFLHAPLCVMRGRGEVIEDVRRTIGGAVVLFVPQFHSATAVVYAAWDRLAQHPARPAIGEVLAAAGSPTRFAPLLFNDLEEATFAAYPELRDLAGWLARTCPSPVRMTGSGAAFFCLTNEPERVLAAANAALGSSPIPMRTHVVGFETSP